MLDLSDVYADQAASVIRRAEIGKNGSLTIFDKIAASDKPLSIEWKMATYAEAELIGPNTIELHQDGKTLYIKLKGKGKITPTVWEEYPLKEYEANDSDVRRVGFIIELKANTSTELEVTLSTTRSKMLKNLWKR